MNPENIPVSERCAVRPVPARLFPAPAVLWVFTMMFLHACTGMHESGDYERHRLSRLEMARERVNLLYFDVSVTAEYPDQNAGAEAKRMEWLEAWMRQRGYCAHGHDVLERRAFRFLEDNPARHDLRYEVACRPAAAD